ncbi:MAG: hypothetical protein EG825_11450 [Rhodocyclaceae bacterium]|nr:hypothetical protein [Rhodocyclaceae bacterium]
MHVLKSIGVIAFLVYGQASAMDVDGYERLVKASEAANEKRYIAKAFLDSYFTGVAETLQFLKTGSQNVYLRDNAALCFPSNVQISGPLIRGVLDGELKNPAPYKELLGPKWKEHQLTGIIIPGLMRMFPCPK